MVPSALNASIQSIAMHFLINAVTTTSEERMARAVLESLFLIYE